MPTKQLNLLSGTWSKDKFAFGGALLKGSHPKKKRCFRPGLALHVVIRSSRARGENSLLRHNKNLSKILDKQAQQHFIRVYGAANAGNHLHLLIQAPSQRCLSAFLRAITGRIAQLVMPTGTGLGFWDARPFSRIVNWGPDFKTVARYLGINSLEMLGMSRESVRAMYEAIRAALTAGLLPKSPGLVAAGFI